MKMIRLMALGLAVAAFGCSDKKTDGPKDGDGKAPASKAAGSTPAKAPAAPVAKPIDAPATVLAFGGINGAAATADTLTALAQQVTPQVPPVKTMLAPMMQNEFKLKDAKVIDLSKPVRFALFDRKQFGRAPEALMFGITDAGALEKALPTTGLEKGADGNGFKYLKYEGARQPVYVNVTGGFAVVTRNKDIFPKHKAFFEALGGATMPEQGALHIEVEHLMAIYGAQFDANLKQMGSAIDQAGAAAQMGGQIQTVKAMFDWFGKAAKDVERVSVILVARPDGLKLDMRAIPKAGSALAKTLTALQGSGRASLAARLPANTPVMALMDFDPAKIKPLSQSLSAAFLTEPIFGDDAAKAKPYLDAMNGYFDGMDGQMALAVTPSPAGMQIVSLFGVKNAKALRAAQETLSGLYKDPAAQAYYQKMGVAMEFQKDAYSVGGTPATIVRTKLTNLPPEAMGMMGMMGDFFVQHMAVGDTIGVMAYGEAGKAQIEAYLGEKAAGGLDKVPSVQRAIKEAASQFSFLVWLNPIELAKGVKLGGMNPLAGALAGVKSASGLGISGGINGGSAQLVIDVPVALVKDGMAAFEKYKGAF